MKVLVVTAFAAAVACLAGQAAPARADDGRTEIRNRVTCSQGTRAAMRLRAEKGFIRIELELEHRRRAGSWRVVVLHERRIAARATLAGVLAAGDLELRRTVRDWFGTDRIVIRASGPRGEHCARAATV